jgi:hypothetical protein
MHNFTVVDLWQTSAATLAFALFLLPPGYLISATADLFGFRRSSAAEKFLMSAAISAAVTPILAVLLIRFLSFPVALGLFLLLAVTAVGDVVRRVIRPGVVFGKPQRSTWIVLALALGWLVVVLGSLADLQIGHRLYVNYVMYDHSVRVPFVAAAARTGVPPLNPFYGLSKPPVLRYYYYWYVVCALPMRLFGLSAKACLDSSVFWGAVGLASTIPLFLKHFFHEQDHLRRKSVIGIALLAVTGLDLIPYFTLSRLLHVLFADMEWWDTNQVTSWLGSLLWVPHHVASMTACMVGLLVFSTIEESQPLRQRAWAVAISAMAFASATGLSLYVTLVFAIFLVIWSLWVLMQKEMMVLASYVAAGILTMIFSVPFLSDLLAKTGGAGTDDRMVSFAFRRLTLVYDFLDARGVHSALLFHLMDLPIAILVYFFEFGFFFAALLLYRRREKSTGKPLSRQQHMAWAMFFSALAATTFLQSSATGSNDFGFRGILIVQFVLLLWAIPVAHDLFFAGKEAQGVILQAAWIKPCMTVLLFLGVSATVYQIGMLRVYAILADTGKLTRMENILGDPGFGERTYWLREGFMALDRTAEPTAVAQYNPANNQTLLAHLYSTRQTVAADAGCGSEFGGDKKACDAAFPYLNAAFNEPSYVRQWDMDEFCRIMKVNLLVATEADPVWRDPGSWVWTRETVYANPALRIVRCGKS